MHGMETTRTRLGKTVGSYRTPLDQFVYWPESNGYMVVAPSGARMKWHETEEAAKADVTQRNRDWFADA
jgi:hypothetical protein